jgi:outer membrane protein TolC
MGHFIDQDGEMFEAGQVRYWLIMILVAYVTPSFSATVGLRDLIQAAQSSQVDWLQAETNFFKAKEGVTIQRSKFLPDLGLSSTYSYSFQENIPDQEAVASSAAITSSWSLWDNGATWRAYKIQLLKLEKASVDQIAARDKMTFEILTKYSQHILARRQREIAERKLKLLQVQFKITERQYRQGLKPISDYQRLQTEVDRARLELSRLEDTTKDTFEELQRYAGKRELIPATDALEIVKGEELLDIFLAQVKTKTFNVDQSTDVRSAQLDVEIEKLNTQGSRAALWPGIDLSAKAGYGSNNFAEHGQRWSDYDRFFSTAQGKLSWTLFNWGGNTSDFRSHILEERMIELKHRQAMLNAETNFSKQFRQATRQEKSLLISRTIFEIERKTYINIESAYRDGHAQYLDLIKSLDSQAQAELDLEQSINSYALILAESLKLTGGLYAALFNK